jgi:hypothetical protein
MAETPKDAKGGSTWMNSRIGFLARQDGDDLVITIDQEFLDTCGPGRWGKLFRERYPGPYRRVTLDVSRCKLVQSTLFAEMLHVRDAYQDAVREGVWLRGPSPRMLAIMDVMQMRDMFSIE